MKNKMFYIDKNETIEDILKQMKEWFEYDSGIVCDGKVAYFKEDTFDKLLDYITNLQEENKRLKEIIKDNTILVKEETGNYKELNINPLDYKSRNEKAIDKLYCYGEVFDSEILKQFQKEMLNILQGSDNNE